MRKQAAAITTAVTLTACGAPSADLFAVQRSGSIPGAKLRIVVNDGGTVRCNDTKPVAITDDQLLAARQLQRDLKDAAERHVDLPARKGSILRYSVATPDGTIRFADNSPGARGALARLTLFTRELATQRCRLAR